MSKIKDKNNYKDIIEEFNSTKKKKVKRKVDKEIRQSEKRHFDKIRGLTREDLRKHKEKNKRRNKCVQKK